MTEEEYLELYEKYEAGTCSAAERARFAAYLAQADLPLQPWRPEGLGAPEPIRQQIWQRLVPHLKQPSAPARRQPALRVGRRARVTLLAAALVLGLGWLGGMLLRQPPRSAGGPLVARTPAAPAPGRPRLVPGRVQALLTLADGRTVRLDEAGTGLLARQGGSQVQKTEPGRLSYLGSARRGADSLLHNSVSTPRGGQYQLRLPDGSRVWLNAASTLRFPVAFGRRRVVQLTGEAYFEVAKDAVRPFAVEAGDARVTVLGTHFNVNAYPDEPALTTTLLEGAVRLSQGSRQVLLRPGQQARPLPDGRIQVREVDARRAVAWKDGRFVFDEEPIEGIMRQVARWYDVDVQYQGQLAEKDFHGSISRSRDAADVLRLLELTGAVHFTTQGRRITVRP